jgi:hypothetical protein
MGVITARCLAAAALLCWIAAWFLPVIPDFPGWAAFRAALAGPFNEAYPRRGPDSIPQVLSALTNVAFVILLQAWYRSAIRNPGMFLRVAIACVLLNLYWPMQAWREGELGSLLAGYYVWLAAFVLLLALGVFNAVSARRTSRTPTDGTPA